MDAFIAYMGIYFVNMAIAVCCLFYMWVSPMEMSSSPLGLFSSPLGLCLSPLGLGSSPLGLYLILFKNDIPLIKISESKMVRVT